MTLKPEDTEPDMCTGDTLSILEERLKSDTDKIVMWCDENRIVINDETNISEISQTTNNTAPYLK